MGHPALLIDGSEGEGGGQIVRSSIALALVTGKAVQIDNIRAGRNKPGVLRQHLTAVRAAAAIGDADVEGAEIGSASLLFRPKTIKPGTYTFIEIAAENVKEVFTGFGRYGVKAEHVAGEALKQARAYLSTNAPVGPYLADQLMLPLALAAWKFDHSSRFRTLALTRHSKTQMKVLAQFLDVPIICAKEDETCLVEFGRW